MSKTRGVQIASRGKSRWRVNLFVALAIAGVLVFALWLIPSRNHGKSAGTEIKPHDTAAPSVTAPAAAAPVPTVAEAVAEPAPSGVPTCTEDLKSTEPLCAWWFDHLKPKLESDAKQIEELKARVKTLEDLRTADSKALKALQQQVEADYEKMFPAIPSS